MEIFASPVDNSEFKKKTKKTLILVSRLVVFCKGHCKRARHFKTDLHKTLER